MKQWLRFLGPLAVLALAAFLLRDKMPFLAEGYQQVLDANSVGLILAFIVTIGSMFAMAEVMRLLLFAGGTNVSIWKTAELTFVANSWSSTFPGGAAISTVYQYQTMRKWNVSVIVSSWFIVVSGVLSTLWLVGLGIVAILFLGASFSVWPLLGSAAVMIGIAIVVYLATTHPKTTSRIICSEVRTFNRLMRRDPERWIPTIRQHIRQLHAVHLPWTRFARIATLSLGNWILEVLGLWLCIWAVTGAIPGLERVGENPSFLGVVLAFVTAKIIGTAQVTPAGLGPVEAAMTASLVAVGMTASSAFGAVFIYRILTFALMTILGWIIYLISVARGGLKAGEQS